MAPVSSASGPSTAAARNAVLRAGMASFLRAGVEAFRRRLEAAAGSGESVEWLRWRWPRTLATPASAWMGCWS